MSDAILKRAVLLDKAPTEIKQYLQLSMPTAMTHDAMRQAVEGFLRDRGQWVVGGDAMDKAEFTPTQEAGL